MSASSIQSGMERRQCNLRPTLAQVLGFECESLGPPRPDVPPSHLRCHTHAINAFTPQGCYILQSTTPSRRVFSAFEKKNVFIHENILCRTLPFADICLFKVLIASLVVPGKTTRDAYRIQPGSPSHFLLFARASKEEK